MNMLDNIHKKLQKVQTELETPKNQYSDFGKYNYRSCEDILESLKPLLGEVGATVLLDDEIVNIGERYYVQATATFIDTEDGETISVRAFAREDENKAKMDLSQMTGSASSYARKYALNGLFAIDDTKDSDATNEHGKGQGQGQATKQQYQPKNKKTNIDPDEKVISDNSLCSDAQLNYIDRLMKNKNYTEKALIEFIKVTYSKTDVKALNRTEASELINMLNEMGK